MAPSLFPLLNVENKTWIMGLGLMWLESGAFFEPCGLRWLMDMLGLT